MASKGTCSIDECASPVSSRGWCKKHYERWRRHGDPEFVKVETMRLRPEAERFWSKVDKHGPLPTWAPFLGPCWLWTKTLADGYGQFIADGNRRVGAHIYTYELLVGPVPVGHELDHLCRVRACCNPNHVEPVTDAENKARSPLMNMDGPNANRVKTHCPAGHAYDEANTYRYRGGRYCRACKRLRNRG